MNPQLSNLLFERYPSIFRLHTSPDSRMSEGLACGDGWFDLIDALCESLQFDIDNNGFPQISVRQVKEKLGTLRFYVGKVSENQRGKILFAESFSGRICDICGRPGKTKNINNFIATRCAEHLHDINSALKINLEYGK